MLNRLFKSKPQTPAPALPDFVGVVGAPSDGLDGARELLERGELAQALAIVEFDG